MLWCVIRWWLFVACYLLLIIITIIVVVVDVVDGVVGVAVDIRVDGVVSLLSLMVLQLLLNTIVSL